MKAKDLRQLIDAGTENASRAVLNMYYFEENSEFLPYSFAELNDYIEDFLIRDVSDAHRYIQRARRDDDAAVIKRLSEYQLKNSDNEKILGRIKSITDQRVTLTPDTPELEEMPEKLGSVKQLRRQIDAGVREGERVGHLKERLALAYVMAEIPYSFSELNDYIEDFLYRDIATAEEHVQMAIRENGVVVIECLGHYQLRKSGNSEYDESIQEKIKSLTAAFVRRTRDLEEMREAIAIHYLGMEDDPERVVYNRLHGEKYIAHWLDGIDPADAFIVQLMKDDMQEFLRLLLTIRQPSKMKKLVELAAKNLTDMKDVKLLALFRFQKDILSADTPQKIANILVDAHNIGVMPEVIGIANIDNGIIQSIVEQRVLIFMKEGAAVRALCELLAEKHGQALAPQLFEAALQMDLRDAGHHAHVLVYLLKNNQVEKLRQPAEPSKDEKSVFVKSTEDITFEYYHASLDMNVNLLLDVAFKNQKMFTSLFLAEMKCLGNPQGRESFYRNLFKAPDMSLFSGYKQCLERINARFQIAGLKLIDRAKDASHSQSSDVEKVSPYGELAGKKGATTTTFEVKVKLEKSAPAPVEKPPTPVKLEKPVPTEEKEKAPKAVSSNLFSWMSSITVPSPLSLIPTRSAEKQSDHTHLPWVAPPKKGEEDWGDEMDDKQTSSKAPKQ